LITTELVNFKNVCLYTQQSASNASTSDNEQTLTSIYKLHTYMYTNIQTDCGTMYTTANITHSDVHVISYMTENLTQQLLRNVKTTEAGHFQSK